MTARQYWYGDPYLTAAYREADELRQRKQNETMWMQGLYIYDAFSVTLANAFRKKGAKAAQYPKEPYDVGKKSEAEKRLLREKEQKKIRDHFESMRQAWIEKNRPKTGNGKEVNSDGS